MRSTVVALALGVALLAASVSSAKPIPLKGAVGPGFTITLTTAKGKPVKSLKAGKYAIAVTDKSGIHSFRLIGKGVNREITTVSFRGTKTVVVTLKPGRAIYECGPHASSMKGSLLVTP